MEREEKTTTKQLKSMHIQNNKQKSTRWRQVEITVLGLVKICLNNCFIYNVIPKKSTCMICVISYIIITTSRMRNLIRTI